MQSVVGRALLLALLFFAAGVFAAPRVVLISVDGLRPDLLRDPGAYGLQLPNLTALRDDGVSADRLVPVFPSLTYPAHVSLVTGTEPAVHGVVSNFKHGYSWYRDAADLRVETLWDRARAAGLRTAIVLWPMGWGANADWVIPKDSNRAGSAFSEALIEGSTPGLIDELSPACGRSLIPHEDDPDAYARTDRYSSCAAAEILKKHAPDLLLLHLANVDHQQHVHGPHHRIALESLEVADGQIGDLRRALAESGQEERTTIVVLGDHGFVPVHTTINLNRLLLDAGYARLEENRIRLDAGVIAATAGGSAAIYQRGAKTRRHSSELLRAMEAVIDAHFHGLLRVIAPAELERMGAFPGAALALAAEPGFLLLGVESYERTLPTGPFKGMHGYDPEVPEMASGLIMAGAEIRKNFRLPMMRQIDVAPTLAHLMGLELPAASGVPIIGVFEYSTRATAKQYGAGPQD